MVSDEIPEDLMKELQKSFMEEIGFMLEECEEAFLKLEDPAARRDELVRIFRVAHSIKGSAAAIGLSALGEFAHTVEDCLAVLRANPLLLTPEVNSLLLKATDSFRAFIRLMADGKQGEWSAEDLKKKLVTATASLQSGNIPAETSSEVAPVASNAPEGERESAAESTANHSVQNTSIKLDASRLDAVLDLVGELVVIRSQVLEAFQEVAASNLVQNSLLALFDKTVRELQDRTLTMRMTTIKPIFVKLQRVTRDLSVKLGKPIEINTSGEDLELDRSMIELLADPLIHIVRNAIDHGIESAEARKAAGKPERGKVSIAARQAGGRVLIEIQDDGAGVHRDRVVRRAIERGLMPQGTDPAKLSDSEVHGILFMPGFSTAAKVTDVSGRGVGLDVVKANIVRLKGTIDLSSRQGEGTRFLISLPLTTAITDGIVVVADSIRMILPMDGIREIAEIARSGVVSLESNGRVARVRDQMIPLVQLRDIFRKEELAAIAASCGVEASGANDARGSSKDTVVIIESLNRSVGLVLDAVIGQSQVVVKPLGPAFPAGNGLSGVAILGDGKVGLVLDIDSLGKVTARAPESEVLVA